jgi:hypothetical protein
MPLSPSAPSAEAVLRLRLRDVASSSWVVQVIALLVALVTALLMLGSASSAWAADGCANAVLRTQNNSTRLPDCRAYEMVSPPYKNGFTIRPQNFSDEGAVSFTSLGGVFAGNGLGVVFNEYVAKRSGAGWATVAPAPSAAEYDSISLPAVEALSPDLGTSLWVTRPRGATGDIPLSYYLRGPDGSMTRVGPVAVPGLNASAFTQAASADLSHIVFAHGSTGSASAQLAALYEHVGTGNNGFARPVSVDNSGHQVAAEACPAPGRTMSVDGRVIVFMSSCEGINGVRQVWARVGGSATVAVSGSECTRSVSDPAGACNDVKPATAAGMAVDGSRVFFTTDQQLVNGDTDASRDLYACEIPGGAPAPVGAATNPCSALIKVSEGLGVSSSARVQGVAAVSDDGSRAYFIAQGVLAENLGTNDAAAVDGQDNLYLWTKDAVHPTGQITFVTTGGAEGQTTTDGRYLVFATVSKLVNAGPGADTDDAADLYRYDAVTKTMVRLSTSVSGGGGNTLGSDAKLNVFASEIDGAVQNSGNRKSVTAMTADGSTVVFETDEALSAEDVDGVADVYAWHDDGRVSLISDGVGGGRLPWITPSGRDIYFFTNARLTALDGDVNGDIYDARVGGGFDLTQPAPCIGDDCQGLPALAPALHGGASDRPGDRGDEAVVPGFSLVAVSAAQRKRLAATGKVTLAIKANTPGTVRVTATVAGLSGVGSARRAVTGPGTVRVALTLSKKARARLAARGRLEVRLVVSHSQVALERSVTLRLTHAKAKQARRGSSSAKRVAGASGGRRS